MLEFIMTICISFYLLICLHLALTPKWSHCHKTTNLSTWSCKLIFWSSFRIIYSLHCTLFFYWVWNHLNCYLQDVLADAQEHEVLFIPGVMTPTEVYSFSVFTSPQQYEWFLFYNIGSVPNSSLIVHRYWLLITLVQGLLR